MTEHRLLRNRGAAWYKYLPSQSAMPDAPFARGQAAEAAAVRRAVDSPAPAQLLHWRPVPGFVPSPETFALSRRDMAAASAVFADAVRLGQLRPGADSGDTLRLWTVALSGLMTRQLANEPGTCREEAAVQHLDRDEIGLLVEAPAERLCALVSDVPRTPEFSPAVVRRTWLDGATGVTASYEVTRPITRTGWSVIERIFRAGDVRAGLRAGTRTTLERVRVAAEAG